jgi:hypothetical protein
LAVKHTEECRGMEGHDSPFPKMRLLEMPEVRRHDDASSAGNRGGKDVPVFLVVLHTGN